MATIESADALTKEELIAQSKLLAGPCAKILTGNHPNVVGAVLLNLTATWIANHHPAQRDSLLANWLNALPEMIKACDRIRASERLPREQLDS
jgi:hypothetical protein